MKKTNKKGFTLAELLIVVAIIAVLTAVAVPLFVSAVDKAENAAAAANVDAVRSAATVKLLENKYDDTEGKTDYWAETYKVEDGPEAATKHYEWYVSATIGKDGSIQDLKIQTKTAAGADFNKEGDYVNSWNKKERKVNIILKETDISST